MGDEGMRYAIEPVERHEWNEKKCRGENNVYYKVVSEPTEQASRAWHRKKTWLAAATIVSMMAFVTTGFYAPGDLIHPATILLALVTWVLAMVFLVERDRYLNLRGFVAEFTTKKCADNYVRYLERKEVRIENG